MSTSWAPVTTGAPVDGMVCPWGVTTGLEIGSPGKGFGGDAGPGVLGMAASAALPSQLKHFAFCTCAISNRCTAMNDALY